MTSFYKILGVPFGLVLYFIYTTVGFHNYAVSIILLTLFARCLMIPSTISQQKGMAKTQRIQSKVRKIQEKYAGDQRKIQEETQALYQREGYNPMNAGCTPMLFQFILLFGLIGAIYYPLSNFLPGIPASEIEILTGLVTKSGTMEKNQIITELLVIQQIDDIVANGLEGVAQATIDKIKSVNFSFFGLFSLGDVPRDYKDGFHAIWLIPILSTLSTVGSSLYSYLKQRKTQANSQAAASMGCMTIFMAAFSLYFVINYPAGIGIYWIASSVFSLILNVVIGHFYSPKKVLAKIMVEETVERRSREENIKFAASANENK